MGVARVADIMSTVLVTATPEDDVIEAAAAMVHAAVRHLPVIDNDGTAVGIVSDRDVRAFIGDPTEALLRDIEETLEPTPVELIMSKNPICVPPTLPVREAAVLLLDNRIGALVVVDERHQLAGVVTTADLLHHAFVASYHA